MENISTEYLLQTIGLLHVEKSQSQQLLSQQFAMLQGKDKEIAKLKEELAGLYKKLNENNA